jgi:hypothetical protein
MTVLEHPPYSPDLAPSLFSKINEILKERHFDNTDDVRSNTTAALKDSTKLVPKLLIRVD